jgi:hypothetical protein
MTAPITALVCVSLSALPLALHALHVQGVRGAQDVLGVVMRAQCAQGVLDVRGAEVGALTSVTVAQVVVMTGVSLDAPMHVRGVHLARVVTLDVLVALVLATLRAETKVHYKEVIYVIKTLF